MGQSRTSPCDLDSSKLGECHLGILTVKENFTPWCLATDLEVPHLRLLQRFSSISPGVYKSPELRSQKWLGVVPVSVPFRVYGWHASIMLVFWGQPKLSTSFPNLAVPVPHFLLPLLQLLILQSVPAGLIRQGAGSWSYDPGGNVLGR